MARASGDGIDSGDQKPILIIGETAKEVARITDKRDRSVGLKVGRLGYHGRKKSKSFVYEIADAKFVGKDLEEIHPTVITSREGKTIIVSLNKPGQKSLLSRRGKLFPFIERVEILKADLGRMDKRRTKRIVRAVHTMQSVVEKEKDRSVDNNHVIISEMGANSNIRDRIMVIVEDIDRRVEDNLLLSGARLRSPHPGSVLRNYILEKKGLSSEFIRKSGFRKIDEILAEQAPFDESAKVAMKEFIGSDADILERLQQVYDYEERTGTVHSGIWNKSADGRYVLAPQ